MRYPFWRVGVFIAAAIWPLLWFYQAFADLLGPDPGKVLVDRLGLGTLVFLLITLSMTPLQKLSGWAGVDRGAQAVGALVFCLCSATSVQLYGVYPRV